MDKATRDLILRAVQIAGSQQALARKIGLSQQGISYLLNHAPRVSAEVAIAMEKATDGQVSRKQLRPDLFEDR